MRTCASELAFVGYHELAVYTATKGAGLQEHGPVLVLQLHGDA